jgi:hypothetical protein
MFVRDIRLCFDLPKIAAALRFSKETSLRPRFSLAEATAKGYW